jgi:hypothetical protein
VKRISLNHALFAVALVLTACTGSTTTTGSVPTNETTSAVNETATDSTAGGASVTAAEPTDPPVETVAATIPVVTDAPTTIPVPTTLALPTLEASADGLGTARFGDDAQESLAYFTTQFGTPGTDSGWGPDPSPCEGMGSRRRIVTWNDSVTIIFATGPTIKIDSPSDHFSAYFVNEPFSATQSVTIGGTPVLGQPIESIQAQIAGISTLTSEIEGPVFVVNNNGNTDLSGTVGEDGIVQSVRAGVICID